MKQITYFVDRTGEDLLISRCGSEVLFSQICYKDSETYEGEAVHAYEVYPDADKNLLSDVLNSINHGIWTKKIPVKWKNVHRSRWGLSPLKEETYAPEWYIDWDTIFVPTPKNIEIPPKLAEFFDGRSDSYRAHWYGQREMFKTWCIATSLAVVQQEIQPLLGDTFTLKLKCW